MLDEGEPVVAAVAGAEGGLDVGEVGHGGSGLLDKSSFALDLVGELFLGRQVELVAGGEDGLLVFGEGVFDHGVVLVGGEDEAKGGVVVGGAALAVVVVDVELELAEILVGELADFEVDEDVALEDGVVEDEVDVEVVAFEGEALLAGEEGEAVAEFEEEGLEVGDEGALQIGLDELLGFGETEELDDEGILEDVGGRLRAVALVGKLEEAFLVGALGEALEEEGGDLAVEFAG